MRAAVLVSLDDIFVQFCCILKISSYGTFKMSNEGAWKKNVPHMESNSLNAVNTASIQSMCGGSRSVCCPTDMKYATE